MAVSCLSPETIARIRTVYAETGSTIETARRCGVNKSTVLKYRDVVPTVEKMTPRIQYDPRDVAFTVTMPEPAIEAGGMGMPEPAEMSYTPFDIDTPGVWGVLSDAHMPFHDKNTIAAAVKEGKQKGVKGWLFNGDMMDCGGVTPHFRDPTAPIFEDDIQTGRDFFIWMRQQFPQARFVYKQGNHELWLPRALAAKLPELFSLKQIQMPNLLELPNIGCEWVEDNRVINLGKLPVLHGHEMRGGGGVNPARWLFLRAVSTAMCGHFHRTSEHHEQGLDRRLHGVWSVGCSCFLYPKYDRMNKWNHGYAFVEVANNGHFTVTNRRILRDGTVA
jgi:hypothetical protein